MKCSKYNKFLCSVLILNWSHELFDFSSYQKSIISKFNSHGKSNIFHDPKVLCKVFGPINNHFSSNILFVFIFLKLFLLATKFRKQRKKNAENKSLTAEIYIRRINWISVYVCHQHGKKRKWSKIKLKYIYITKIHWTRMS